FASAFAAGRPGHACAHHAQGPRRAASAVAGTAAATGGGRQAGDARRPVLPVDRIHHPAGTAGGTSMTRALWLLMRLQTRGWLRTLGRKLRTPKGALLALVGFGVI